MVGGMLCKSDKPSIIIIIIIKPPMAPHVMIVLKPRVKVAININHGKIRKQIIIIMYKIK